MGFRRRLMMAQRSGEPHLPAGYTRLEYIKSDGGYIDTGYPLQLNDVIELDVRAEIEGGNNVFYGVRRAGTYTGTQQIYGGLDQTGQGVYSVYLKVCYGTATFNVFPMSTRSLLRIETGSTNYVYVNGVLSFTTSDTGVFNSNGSSVYNPCIFTFNSLGTPNTSTIWEDFYCYGYRIIRGGIAFINLVPALRDLDQVAGMYDLANNTFLTSPNGVSFIGG